MATKACFSCLLPEKIKAEKVGKFLPLAHPNGNGVITCLDGKTMSNIKFLKKFYIQMFYSKEVKR